MADKALLRLRRVTDLFETGRELVLADNDAEPVLVWISKLNTFERGDTQRDASAARARRVAGLTDDSDEIRAIVVQLRAKPRDQKVEFIVAPQVTQAFFAAQDDVRADPEWKANLELLERHDALEAGGSPPSDDERDAIAKIRADYEAAVEAALEVRKKDLVAELEGIPEEELDAKYLDVARQNLGSNAFFEEYNRSELYFALRDCDGRRRKNGAGYDHATCTHQRLLPSKAALSSLPEELLERFKQVLADMTMTPGEAGNSDAPASSSESSGQASSAEDSPPSTPTET